MAIKAVIFSAPTLIEHDPDGRAVGLLIEQHLPVVILVRTVGEHSAVAHYEPRGATLMLSSRHDEEVRTRSLKKRFLIFVGTETKISWRSFLENSLTFLDHKIERDEIVYVGDSSEDVESAKRARLDFLVTLTGEFQLTRPKLDQRHIVPTAAMVPGIIIRRNRAPAANGQTAA